MSTVGRQVAPWEDYGEAVVGKDDAELDKAVEEYSKHRHEGSGSSQSKEELARWKEGNDEIAKEYQWVHPSEYADEGLRIGRILSHAQLINLLRDKCKLKCFYREMGHPQKIALWVQRNESVEPEVGCWVQYPMSIEYSIMDFDSHGVPLAEKFRGWRTVLMQLALKGVITESKINTVFGPATGPASPKYNAFFQSLRKNF